MKNNLKFTGILLSCLIIGFFLLPSVQATMELNSEISIPASSGDTITYNITKSTNPANIGQKLVITFGNIINQSDVSYFTAKIEIINRTSDEILSTIANSSSQILGYNESSKEIFISNNTNINFYGIFGIIPINIDLSDVGEKYIAIGFEDYFVDETTLIVSQEQIYAAARNVITLVMERDLRGFVTNTTLSSSLYGISWSMVFESTTINYGEERFVPGYGLFLTISILGSISIILIIRRINQNKI